MWTKKEVIVMKLGARIFKTGIAVALSIYISHLLGLDSVIFAAIAALFTIQPSVYRSWKYMLEQIKANIIGASLAVTAIFTLGTEPWVVGLVVILAIAINLKLGFENSITMSVIVIIAVMEVPEVDKVGFVVDRFLTIMIGVLSAMVINVLFAPPKYEKILMEKVRETNEKMSSFLRLIINGEADEMALKKEHEAINKTLGNMDNLYGLYKEEFNGRILKVGYSKTKKLVILKNFVYTAKKTHSIIEALESHYRNVHFLPDNLREGIQQHLKLVIEYKEKIIMKNDGKIRVQQHHQVDEQVEISGELLMKEMLKYTSKEEGEEEDKNWVHGLLIVASIVELTQELDKLDKLVNTQRKYIKKEK